MKIDVFMLRAPEGFEWLQPANPENDDLFLFDGSPRARSWMTVRMKRLEYSEEGRRESPSDFPFGTNELVVSPRARDALAASLEACGELLPLVDTDGGKWWVFNPTRLVSCLDMNASDVLRASGDPNRILMIREHVFDAARLAESTDEAFKLAEMPHGRTYFRGSFVERVRSLGLVGAEFVEPV